MNKLEIFEDVVAVMREDSSSCKDKKGADPSEYRKKIREDMPDIEFLFLVNSYLATFGLTGHLWFGRKGIHGIMFQVQRYENVLYVTKAAEQSGLTAGEKIIGIDGLSVKEFGERHKEFLFGETEERQAPHWNYLLKYAKTVTVEDAGGNIRTVEIVLGKGNGEGEKYVCRELEPGITFLRLADFNEEDKIQQLYAENEVLMKNSKILVIDARGNGGGSDTAFLPLIPYCLPVGMNLRDIDFGSDGMEINYSVRNCEMRLKAMEEYLEMELPEETRTILNDMKGELQKNFGKGFCQEGSQVDLDIPADPDTKVEKVYIITDSNCASSGDNFVQVFGKLPKVTVVGRPTMGILDYSNVAMIEYSEFWIGYPTSRLMGVENGNGMMGKGVPVDVYVPWTPEHLKRDVDMDKVRELIQV